MAKKDATVKGVSSDETGGASEKTEFFKGNDPHELDEPEKEKESKIVGTGHSEALEAIAQRADKELYKEMGIDLEEKPKEEKEKDESKPEEPEKSEKPKKRGRPPKKAKAKQEVEPPEEKEPELTEDQIEKILKTQKRKIVVDGVEREATIDELLGDGIRTRQKESAADKRLEEAARIKKEVEALRAEVMANKQQSPDKTEVAEKDTKQAALEDAQKKADEARQAFVKATQYGEEDEIDAAVKKWDSAKDEVTRLMYTPDAAKEAATPQVDPQVMTSQIKAELKAEQIRENFAKAKDQGGYADVWEDPRSQMLVINEVNKLVSEGADGLDWATYQKAGDEIRKFLGRGDKTPTQEKEDPEPEIDDMSEKVEKKRQIDTLESASTTPESKVTEEKEPTPSEIIANIAKNRPGQNVY